MVQGWATSPDHLDGGALADARPGRSGDSQPSPRSLRYRAKIDRPWAWLVGSEVHAGSDLTSE
jgi:hypothetical protein